jgi:hypothetical protein
MGMTRSPSKTETFTLFVILAVLAAIGVGVFLKQFHFSPAILSADVLMATNTPSGQAHTGERDLAVFLADGMLPMGAAERYNAENMSDKIDGKAELYLQAGFVGMQCQRFAAKNNPGAWMEACVYDMGNTRNAFAVFSGQRRSGAEKLSLTDFAYGTKNAVFFAHGRYYVELVAALEDRKMDEAMQAFARGFIAKTTVSKERIDELALFASEHLRADSVVLLAADAFGFAGFNNVFTASYGEGNAATTVFLSLRSTPEEAAKLSAAYYAFLTANGGAKMEPPANIPNGGLVNIMETFELIFSDGRVVAGVHAAESRAAAEALAVALSKHIREVGQ